MRSGHASNIFALDALRKIGLQPASEVIIQSVPEEESTGNGTMMTHLKGYKADAVLIPEPVQEQLVRANVGVLWFQIEVRGRPVHVRTMGTGVNAVDACWGVVGALRELEAEWNQRHVKTKYFEEEKHPLSKSLLSLPILDPCEVSRHRGNPSSTVLDARKNVCTQVCIGGQHASCFAVQCPTKKARVTRIWVVQALFSNRQSRLTETIH